MPTGTWATWETATPPLAAKPNSPPIPRGAQLTCQAGYDVAKGAAVFRFVGKSRVHPEREVRRAPVLAVGCGG